MTLPSTEASANHGKTTDTAAEAANRAVCSAPRDRVCNTISISPHKKVRYSVGPYQPCCMDTAVSPRSRVSFVGRFVPLTFWCSFKRESDGCRYRPIRRPKDRASTPRLLSNTPPFRGGVWHCQPNPNPFWVGRAWSVRLQRGTAVHM